MKETQQQSMEEPQEIKQPVRKKRTITIGPATWFAAAGIALFIGIVGFVGGLQTGRLTNAVARNTRNVIGMGGQYNNVSSFPTASYGVSGPITAVSATSITVSDTRQGGSTTYAITSSTSVTNGGVTASVSDLKVGDTVRIRASTSNTSDASLIELNPVTRGRGMINTY